MFFPENEVLAHTLRQASRRSWRIGKTEQVTVKYFAYANTALETCLRLMGRKLLVALAMEGKFSTEGLQAVGEDDDLLMAMARKLVTEKGIGESAELVWREIQQRNAAFAHAVPSCVEPGCETSPEASFLQQNPLPSVIDQLVLFSASLNAASGRKRTAHRPVPAVPPAYKQLALF